MLGSFGVTLDIKTQYSQALTVKQRGHADLYGEHHLLLHSPALGNQNNAI